MTAQGWEKTEFSDMIAWNTGDIQKSYSELNQDLASLAVPNSRLWYFEDRGPYQNALLYLKAWKLGKTLCLLPKTWPDQWKKEALARLQDCENEIPAETFYLLPTSGSSGRPKLVIVTRDNWTAFFNATLAIYKWKPGTRVALTFDGVFDPFIAMVFLSLSQGATVFALSDRNKFDPFSFLQKNSIQVWSSVPSLISLNWARKPAGIQTLPDLVLTMFTGEALSPQLLSLWMNLSPESQIENLYGPVEATVWATRLVCQSHHAKAASVPIGQALSSVQTCIHDGELILKGSQVAMGYLTDRGIHPFHSIYHSGDLVEEKDSMLFFLGRKDQQVKIRGQRIELEAIEAVVLNKVQAASICTVDEGGNLCLILSKPAHLPDLFDFLKNQLPVSHLPRIFYLCNKWPMTTTGKVDRQALQRMIINQELVRLDLQKDPT